MNVASDDLTLDETYKLMTGMIVPRPIAWVTSRSPDGIVNLAPFSAFTFLSTRPPIVGISITRRSGALKDTARNIEATGEFVVHIADESLLEPLHASSAEYGHEVSEPERLGLALISSGSVCVPRLAVAPAAMECRLDRFVEFGDLASGRGQDRPVPCPRRIAGRRPDSDRPPAALGPDRRTAICQARRSGRGLTAA